MISAVPACAQLKIKHGGKKCAVSIYDGIAGNQDTYKSLNGKWIYAVNGNKTIILGQYLGKEKKVKIPQKIDGKKVVAISCVEFAQSYGDGMGFDREGFIPPSNKTTKEVWIPCTVSTIFMNAFLDPDKNDKVRDLYIPKSVKNFSAYGICGPMDCVDAEVHVSKSSPIYKECYGKTYGPSGKKLNITVCDEGSLSHNFKTSIKKKKITRTCKACGYKHKENAFLDIRTPSTHLVTLSRSNKRRKKITLDLRFAEGDKVKYIKPDKLVVIVNKQKRTLTAVRKGQTRVTVKLKSGIKKSFNVRVE
jgi:hypothetical protein